jgi:peptide deformylase
MVTPPPNHHTLSTMKAAAIQHHHQRLLDQVLIKGNPLLSKVCMPVTVDHLTQTDFRNNCTRLCETLLAFRATHGYGRAIAAPQIGIPLRMIALNLKACVNYTSIYQHRLSRPKVGGAASVPSLSAEFVLPGDCLVLMNPEFTYKSQETKAVWDDCLSLPDTMVRVRRSEKIGIQWMDLYGHRHTWQPDDICFDLAELLQHEMDHLDGTLATDIVAPHEKGEGMFPCIVSRADFDSRKDFFQSYVDYTI